jgi:uncharacterized protein YecE (DUF72 family)
MSRLFLGTSGFHYKDWKQVFYPAAIPQRLWLEYYSSQYKTVEINNSFYSTIKPQIYHNWYQQTPPDFAFSVKGHRYITQLKKLEQVDESVNLFFNNVLQLKEKLSCVLWQFPANFVLRDKVHFERLNYFLSILPTSTRHAFEFRDDSWFCEPVYSLFKKNRAALVISQSSLFPQIETITADFVYIRFHGPDRLYASGYTEKELQDWSLKIKTYLKTCDVYCYFNNDAGGFALTNIKTLSKYLENSD